MERLIGRITHHFGKIGVAVIEITEGELSIGDNIHIKGKTTDFYQKVDSMQIEHQSIEKATKGQSVGLKIISPVKERDEVYIVTEE